MKANNGTYIVSVFGDTTAISNPTDVRVIGISVDGISNTYKKGPVDIIGHTFLDTRGTGKVEFQVNNNFKETKSYTSWNNNEIVCEAPPQTGTFDVRITNNDGDQVFVSGGLGVDQANSGQSGVIVTLNGVKYVETVQWVLDRDTLLPIGTQIIYTAL